MLPENLSHFYRYQGSLTTPPCSESVIWTIFHSPIVLSHTQASGSSRVAGPALHFWAELLFPLPSAVTLRCSQISLLENTLLDWQNRTLRNDYRHAQPLNGRAVESSFPAKPSPGNGVSTQGSAFPQEGRETSVEGDKLQITLFRHAGDPFSQRGSVHAQLVEMVQVPLRLPALQWCSGGCRVCASRFFWPQWCCTGVPSGAMWHHTQYWVQVCLRDMNHCRNSSGMAG
ncbi:carbonic anhydrase VI [Columba livia]|uniref:Carbonic anhydrase 6 n=1 Tax=Columba livia TaxID=8932 RepID=A0A2I0M309_COLLI|nr:carbonic anhydrase VI [Columba livia]